MYTICCLHFPHYPALAARFALNTQRMVIVEANGRVMATTPDGTAGGITAGMSIGRARALVSDAVITERDHARELAVWETVMDMLYSSTPLLTSPRIGEAYCAVDNRERIATVLEQTLAQAGIARTRTLALLAAVRSRPSTMTYVHDDDEARFLAEWPVALLRELHVDDDTVERLELFGLATLAHLRHLTERHLHVQFGEEGRRLHALLKQLPVRTDLPFYTPPPSIDVVQHFDEAQREPSILEPLLLLMADQATQLLQGRRTSVIEVRARNNADVVVQRATRILKEPTTSASSIRTVGTILLRQILSAHQWWYGIEVVLKGLMAPLVEQTSLFAQRASLDDVATHVYRRFPHAVLRIERHTPDAYLPEHTFALTHWQR